MSSIAQTASNIAPSIPVHIFLTSFCCYNKLFLLNSQIHNIHTRHNDNLHLPLTGLTLVQKGIACKIYNHLPLQIKNMSNNVALFISTLKKFLLQYVFYRTDEYYQQNQQNKVISKVFTKLNHVNKIHWNMNMTNHDLCTVTTFLTMMY
jgi:hypothetical protein